MSTTGHITGNALPTLTTTLVQFCIWTALLLLLNTLRIPIESSIASWKLRTTKPKKAAFLFTTFTFIIAILVCRSWERREDVMILPSLIKDLHCRIVSLPRWHSDTGLIGKAMQCSTESLAWNGFLTLALGTIPHEKYDASHIAYIFGGDFWIDASASWDRHGPGSPSRLAFGDEKLGGFIMCDTDGPAKVDRWKTISDSVAGSEMCLINLWAPGYDLTSQVPAAWVPGWEASVLALAGIIAVWWLRRSR
jgi:hypothetical protein